METGNIFQLLGTAGSLIMCVSSVPQIIKTYKVKRADNLSGSYLAVLITGMSLILLYALHVRDMVFILGNGISLTLTVVLVVMRYVYNLNPGHRRQERRNIEDR